MRALNRFNKITNEGSSNNKFLSLINSPVLNTSNVTRYSLMHMSKHESLSDHISDVCLMSYLITSILISKYDEDLDLGLVLEKAVVHDLDEVLTGDIVRTTKYYSEDILNSLNKMSLEIMNGLSESLVASSRLKDTWETAKDGKEGIIIKLVDMLSVSKKAVVEVVLLNNEYFQKVSFEMKNNLLNLVDSIKSREDFKFESKLYLLSLINDALEVMESITDKEFMDVYGISNNILRAE